MSILDSTKSKKNVLKRKTDDKPKKKLGRPKKAVKDNYVKFGVAIPNYLFDKLDRIEEENLNFSKESVEVLKQFIKNPKKFRHIKVTEKGKFFKQKVIYIPEREVPLLEECRVYFKAVLPDAKTGLRLKLSDVVVNEIYSKYFE